MTDPLQDPGVAGLAQLGRNAIERVMELERELAAAVAERDDYRDEFRGLCHTLSVGSEGRPEMTAADWRKRVDQGIDFLTRPLLSRIEAIDKELAKRAKMLDICTQNCSDWIGRWKLEQDRAERAEAHLAASCDVQAHFDVLKGDYDEAAHFARHFVRDDPHITPRGAIIRLGDKCTDLFCRLQSAEQERDRTESQRQFACAEVARIATERDAATHYASELNDSLISVNAEAVRLEQERDALKLRAEQAEARLAEIEAAPTVQTVFVSPFRQIELIARPTKDQP